MEYDRFASALSSSYEVFAAGLKSLYLEARLAHSASRPQALLAMRSKADRLLSNFLNNADELAGGYLSILPVGARQHGSRSPAMLFISNLKKIALDNASFTNQKITVSIGSILTRQGDAMSKLARLSADNLEFVSKDQAGRTWRSATLVKTLARDFAYQRFIDYQVYAFGLQGFTLAKVNYLDPNHQDQGLIVSLGEQAGYVSLESVRTRIFHPNASATLSHV